MPVLLNLAVWVINELAAIRCGVIKLDVPNVHGNKVSLQIFIFIW